MPQSYYSVRSPHVLRENKNSRCIMVKHVTLPRMEKTGSSITVFSSRCKIITLSFQIVGPFIKSRFIDFIMHLDIYYIEIHTKN
jgi:hypothetical protein